MRVSDQPSPLATAVAATEEAAHSLACRNCEASLAPAYVYCPQCGQETHDAPPHFFEFVHEFIHHYVALEGTLWKSLWLLLVRPGKLTLEYLAGRKNRYVWPLRLFFTLSFVFFLSLKLMNFGHSFMGVDPGEGKSSAVLSEVKDGIADKSIPTNEALNNAVNTASAEVEKARAEQAKAEGGKRDIHMSVGQGWLPSFAQARVDRFNAEAAKDPAGTFDHLGKAFIGSVPTAILALLPFFAGILALVFWRRRMAYGAHFVFTLHLHAFWYLCLWLLLLSPWRLTSVAIWAWMNVYTVMALKRVYGGSWIGTLLRSGLIAVLHWILIVIVIVADILFISLA